MKKTSTDDKPLAPRAQRVVDAGKLLHGVEWMTKFALDVGISKQMMGFIARGRKPVSDNVDALVVAALRAKAQELRGTSKQLLALSKLKLTHAERFVNNNKLEK